MSEPKDDTRNSGEMRCYLALEIDIIVPGAGCLLPDFPTIVQSNAVPRVGERVICDYIMELSDKLDKDADYEFVVTSVWWHFGRSREELDCDATVWVECPYFSEDLKKWHKSR